MLRARWSPSWPPQSATSARSMTSVVDLRIYRLKASTGADFHRLVTDGSVPLLQRFGVDVVAYGPSLTDPDVYYLMRAYPTPDALRSSEDTFYGSDDWQHGPRQS